MDEKQTREKTFSIELTKEQIAIIKAGLQYYWLAEDYGYAIYCTMPGVSFGTSDRTYRLKVGEIYEELNKSSKTKPNYGWWGGLKRIAKLCKEDYKKAEKQGEEDSKRMYADDQRMNEEALRQESIKEEIDKHGLNGSEILNRAYMSYQEKLKKPTAEPEKTRQKKEGKKRLPVGEALDL